MHRNQSMAGVYPSLNMATNRLQTVEIQNDQMLITRNYCAKEIHLLQDQLNGQTKELELIKSELCSKGTELENYTQCNFQLKDQLILKRHELEKLQSQVQSLLFLENEHKRHVRNQTNAYDDRSRLLEEIKKLEDEIYHLKEENEYIHANNLTNQQLQQQLNCAVSHENMLKNKHMELEQINARLGERLDKSMDP